MAEIVKTSVDVQLRKRVQKHIDDTGASWYRIAKGSGIDPIQIIYRFRDGDGMNAENTFRLMKYLDIELEDIDID